MLHLLILAQFVVSGPPDPVDPRIAMIEARLEETKRVADGTFTDGAILAVSSAWDIWTTERCIARNPNCYELNPLGKDSGASRIALKSAYFPIALGSSYVLRRAGHHKTARISTLVISAAQIAVGFINLDKSKNGKR
jgi:hypothetical protein